MRQSLATRDGIFGLSRRDSGRGASIAPTTLPPSYGDRNIPAPSAPSQAGSRDPLVSEGSGGRIAQGDGGGRRGRDFGSYSHSHGLPSGLSREALVACAVGRVALGSSPRERGGWVMWCHTRWIVILGPDPRRLQLRWVGKVQSPRVEPEGDDWWVGGRSGLISRAHGELVEPRGRGT